MLKIIARDRKGQFLQKGDCVVMPNPDVALGDLWLQGNFCATIIDSKMGDFAEGKRQLLVVEDAEGDCWDVEPDRVTRDGTPSYPFYGADEEKMPDGLYLGLFHGFENEEQRQEVDDWGEKGALIGPLAYVQTTYACHVKTRFINKADAETYGLPSEVCTELPIQADCLFFDGKYYGDWTVFYIQNGKVAGNE